MAEAQGMFLTISGQKYEPSGAEVQDDQRNDEFVSWEWIRVFVSLSLAKVEAEIGLYKYIGVSIREPEEQFKLKNNVGTRTNEY